jgi:serine phosphatase RsbU (regulator of sigma subunit)
MQGSSDMDRILVIEDEESILIALQGDLELEGYQVKAVKDSLQGFSMAKEGGYDLIILDIMPPSMDGFEVCKQLRQAGVGTPILMLSARSQEIDRVLGLELGADDYVTKPFSPRELLARVKAILRRARQCKVEEEVGVEIDAIDESAGIDLTHREFTLSITENQLRFLESANQELLRKQLRHEQELAIAADIQKKLLPRGFPQGMGIQIAASSAMAKVVGGDYYDLTTNQKGQLSLIVADSMGKGIPAALLMTTIRAIWRGCSAMCCRSPGQVLETINKAMHQDLRATESFITMFGAIYDPETSIFRYSSAGHSPAIFRQASGTEDRMLDVGGLPVGILPDSDFPSDEVLMREGDIIVMYTDGVVEAADENGHLFGTEGLCDVIDQHRSSDAEVIKGAILSEVDSHTNGSPLADDTTLVVLKKA